LVFWFRAPSTWLCPEGGIGDRNGGVCKQAKFFFNGEWGETADDVDRIARAAHCYKTLLEKNAGEIARIMTTENGKHAHGKDAIAFNTEQKVVMTRWF
jgi:hypothetical protein